MSPTSNVVPFGRMSVADYERERQSLRETYGDKKSEAAARFEQALAKLFYRSGWTQDELAKKEEKSRQWIVQRLCFGRFLNFATTVANLENPPFTLPASVTERKFRAYWERTDKAETNERARFLAVARLMAEETVLVQKRRRQIGSAIAERFADGKWHQLATIARTIDAPEPHVFDTLHTMQALRGTYGCQCEKKRVGEGWQFRIFPRKQTISSVELMTKLDPLITELEAEGRKNQVTMCVATVARAAALLRRQVEAWIAGAATDRIDASTGGNHKPRRR